MRTATGGLAASDSTMPLSISARIAPSIGRSTVHHQSDSGLRSSRESIGGAFGTALPFVADGGYGGVNGANISCDEKLKPFGASLLSHQTPSGSAGSNPLARGTSGTSDTRSRAAR